MYPSEDFSTVEADVLRRYFTNLDQPVFALVNLPEVVKGALSPGIPGLTRAFGDCS